MSKCFQKKMFYVSAAHLVVVLLASCMAGKQAKADIIHYDDVEGYTVDFVEIMEMSNSSGELFGQPEANSDSISMPALGFNASANNGVEFKQGLMEMTIVAEQGTKINSIKLQEFGSFFLFGDDTDAIVHTSAFVEIGDQVFDAQSTFSQSGSGQGNWDQSFELAFPEAEKIRLVIDTQVLASADDGEVAFVDKIGMNVQISSVSAVPEPSATLALASTLLFGLAWARRRKLQKK